ncbi:HAMP domain-containing protein [Streptosporangium sp. NPDC004379]|uniref:HAMP domain-containing protein n=1 Tax=Streptosporangium sp. NPDC004379 TaxID=3366189 RepID=UPI0036A289AB
MTLRARSTAITALLTTVIVVLGLVGLLIVLRQMETVEVRGHAASLARQNAMAIREGRAPSLAIADDGTVIQLVRGGRVISSAPESAAGRPLTTTRPDPGDPRWDGTVTWNKHRMIIVGSSVPGGAVYVAQPEPGLFFDPPRVALLGVAGLACVGLVALATWVTTSQALTPVQRICAELCDITATDLSRRVPEPRGPEEIRRLARAINDTLARLEEAVGRQQRFAADASHASFAARSRPCGPSSTWRCPIPNRTPTRRSRGWTIRSTGSSCWWTTCWR